MRTLFCLLIASLGLGGIASSQEPTPAPSLPPEATEPASQPVNNERENNEREIDELIQQLDSPRFAVRNQAASKLKNAGNRAIPALQKTALKGEAEPSNRALKILGQHLEDQEDDNLNKAAKIALENIASDGAESSSSIARRILTDDADAKSRPLNPRRMIPPIAIRPNAMQVQIRVQNNNGKFEIKQKINGKSVRIAETNQGIEVERQDAQGKMNKKTYKTAEELKQKDKEAYQTYQKFKKGAGGIQIRINGNVKPGPSPKLLPQLPGMEIRQKLPEELRKRHEEILKRQRDSMERLREAQRNLKQQIPEAQRDQFEDLLKRQREAMDRQLLDIQQALEPENQEIQRQKDSEKKTEAPADNTPAAPATGADDPFAKPAAPTEPPTPADE